VTHGSSLCLNLVHPLALNLGGLFPRLLHLKEHRTPVLQAQQVWHARQLVRPAVNLHDPPALLFG
jgi:hypothetical protein